ESLSNILQTYSDLKEYKIGKTMWPIRIGVTGQTVTPGGGAEMLYLLGKEESLKRLNRCMDRLS
ncbi:MAG: glutamate--tRNA ligase, partial [Clostridia bacterium]|nr:glutamate--tRNA ligase [Clostridia bacterium]